MNFRGYMTLSELKELGLCFLPESFNWAKPYALAMPKIDLGLPSVTKTSQIMSVQVKKNPIIIEFKDGARVVCSYDQFRRLSGPVEPGRTATYTMLVGDHGKPMVVRSFKVIS